MRRNTTDKRVIIDHLLVVPLGQRLSPQDERLKIYQLDGQTIVYFDLLAWLHAIKPNIIESKNSTQKRPFSGPPDKKAWVYPTHLPN